MAFVSIFQFLLLLLFWQLLWFTVATTETTTTKTCETLRNAALVFVKPHANTPAVRELVRLKLEEAGLTIDATKDIDAKEINRKKLIDKHYYSIASKATLQSPAELVVPTEKFQGAFGEDWQTVLSEGRAANALQACEILNCTPEELNAVWDQSKVIKLGGGFYCGRLVYKDTELYVFNAFFLSMRAKFVEPGASIHVLTVSWDPSTLSWQSFRRDVLGATDPKEAVAGSLRRTLLDHYEQLGLDSEPSKADNGVHASASPLEGLAERCNWLGATVERDAAFGQAVLEAGIPKAVLQSYLLDAMVPLSDGQQGSVFDALEDLDAGECLAKMVQLNDLSNSKSS